MSSQEKLHLVPKKRNREDEETNAKMRALWTILIVLVIALIAAIVYEIVLGNGTQQTGSQRMEEISREPVIVTETETESETEAESETEPETEAESETEPETEIESEAEPETETESEAEPEPETVQDSGQSEGKMGGDTPFLTGIAGL